MQTTSRPVETEIAAAFEGLQVPASPFLNDRAIGMINSGDYERPERKLSAKLVQEGDRVIEMGAGIGFVGGYTAFKKKDMQLKSFEANPNLIPHIESLYGINGLSGRAQVRNELLVANPDRPATMSFHLHESFLGSSLFEARGMLGEPVDVPTTSWDAVKSDFTPDVILMDIEGAELDFLTHADLSAVRAVIFEVHPRVYGKEGEAACLEALRAQGFRQAHHRMNVYSFVAEGVEVPR